MSWASGQTSRTERRRQNVEELERSDHQPGHSTSRPATPVPVGRPLTTASVLSVLDNLLKVPRVASNSAGEVCFLK